MKISNFNFPSTPLVVVTDGEGDEDVTGALVRLSPALDAAQRGVFDRVGARQSLMKRGAIAVRWAPKMLSPQHVPEASEPQREGDGESVAQVAAAWIDQCGANRQTRTDAITAVRAILEHAGVSG